MKRRRLPRELRSEMSVRNLILVSDNERKIQARIKRFAKVFRP